MLPKVDELFARHSLFLLVSLFEKKQIE